MSDTEQFTVEDLKRQVADRLAEMRQPDSPMLILSAGWDQSPHYKEGWHAGQFALLLEIQKALDEIATTT